MGMHRFPVTYSITGKEAGKKKEITAQCFHTMDLYVREVDEIDTSVIGSAKRGEHIEKILFFEGKFWIKDGYSNEDAARLRTSTGVCTKADSIGNASTFRNIFYDSCEKEWINDEVVDETTRGFKSVKVSTKQKGEETTRNRVETELIEIDGELYVHVQEPIYRIAASRDFRDNRATASLVFFNMEAWMRYPDYEKYDYDIRIPFDKRHEFDAIIEELRDNQVEVFVHVEGEHFFGGEFSVIKDEIKNLKNSAKEIVRDGKWYIEDWPVPQLIAWGETRDALRKVEQSNGHPEDFDQLAKAMSLYIGIEGREGGPLRLPPYAFAALHRWNTRELDLSEMLNLSLEDIDNLPTMK